MYRIKKKQKLLYKSAINVNETREIELKVICKENFGDELVAKCKVLSKDWYKEVYITQQDINSGKVKII